VKFSLGGRKYGDNKVWNALSCFYVGNVDGSEPAPEAEVPMKMAEPPAFDDIPDDGNEVPF
jgi:hypothetical protein